MFTALGKYQKSILVTVIISVFLIFTGCDEDNSTEPQMEHFEAIGTLLYSSGIEVASILRGETTDTLRAHVDSLSQAYDVKFYDEDENVIDPPDHEESSLDWQIDNPDLLEVWQHPGEEGGFEFHFRGLKAGETEIEFFILHNGHSDYRSGKFPVVIEEK
jgi:hypothetical protein